MDLKHQIPDLADRLCCSRVWRWFWWDLDFEDGVLFWDYYFQIRHAGKKRRGIKVIPLIKSSFVTISKVILVSLTMMPLIPTRLGQRDLTTLISAPWRSAPIIFAAKSCPANIALPFKCLSAFPSPIPPKLDDCIPPSPNNTSWIYPVHSLFNGTYISHFRHSAGMS